MAVLLLFAFSSIFNEGMAAEGLDFVVSPEPAHFTVHPRSDVALEGTTVTLHCSAHVVDIGGFRRPLHTDTVPWRRYEIDWEFMPAPNRGAGGSAVNMPFTAAAKDVNLQVLKYRDTQGMTISSTLTISGSMLSNSGAYRCAVQDWELKYTSYHGLIQIIPRAVEDTSHREMTVAPLLAAVRLPCSSQANQTEGNWWNHFQTTSWAVVENGGITASINSSMGFTMSNGDLVLYGGFPSLHLECHRHWTSAFGLPVANGSHTLRLHVSETGQHDIVTEDLVTVWLGDKVELVCNLSLQDDTVAWYHDDHRLASDGSNGYVFDPSGPMLQFEALSASYQGWYVCTLRENRRHSTQLIIRGRRDLNGVSSAAGLQEQTHYISSGDATKVLDCNTPEDPEDKVLLYEWTIDGVFANTSAASLSASHTGVYVCYSHLKDKTLTTIHRVLPHGYVNPITNLKYPRAEVVGGTTADPIMSLHFSWRPPEILGGLTSTDIQYRVQLMTEGGVTVAADVIPDLFFERNFSGFDNITTRMNITVSAEPRDSSLTPSLPTVIPYAAVLEWYRFDIKVYCNSTQLNFHVQNPLYHLLAHNNLRYYHARLVGNYYSIRLENETVTGDYLRKHGKLTEFSPNYELPIPDKYIRVKHELWFMDEGNVGQGTIHKERYRSAAVAFYPSFAKRNSPDFFLRHFQEDDYYVCNFEDPPEISFAVGYIEIVGTPLVHSAFLHLSKPANTRFLVQVVHDDISQDVWVESKQVEVPFSLTPTHGSVQYTLTMNEDYDNVATVGQNRTLVVNFTRPPRTNTSSTEEPTEEPTEEGTTSDNRVDLIVALTTAGVAGVVIAVVGLCLCLFARLQRKSMLKRRATELETLAIKADSDKQLHLVEIDNSPVDDVTDYDVLSRRSFDVDVTCSKSETSVSMQLKTTHTHTKSSNDYTHLWTCGMAADGCDSLPLGYTWDNGSPAQTPSCECADAQSYSSGIQFPQTDDTTCTTCTTVMATARSGYCINWSTSTPDTSTPLVSP